MYIYLSRDRGASVRGWERDSFLCQVLCVSSGYPGRIGVSVATSGLQHAGAGDRERGTGEERRQQIGRDDKEEEEGSGDSIV